MSAKKDRHRGDPACLPSRGKDRVQASRLGSNHLADIAKELQQEALKAGDPVPHEEEIRRVAEALSQYTAPEPARAGTALLSAALARELACEPFWVYSPAQVARIILLQLRFFPALFWLVAPVLLLGGLLATPYFRPGEINLMVASVPWLGSLGTLFGLGRSKGAWGELETLAPMPPALLALARTLACLSIATLASLSVTVLAFFLGREQHLWSFTVSWLAPLLLSAALALLLSLACGMRRSLAATAVIWGTQTLYHKGLGPFAFLSLPGDPFWAASKGLAFCCAAACLGLACIFLKRGHPEREGQTWP